MGSADLVREVRAYSCPTGHGRNFVFVALETDSGIVGFGEASQSDQDGAVLANIHEVAPAVRGADIFNLIEPLAKRLRSARSGRAMSVAISGLELAVWDALGKSLDRPVFELLGGCVRSTISCYATMSAGVTEWDCDSLALHAAQKIGEGYRGVKLRPFYRLDEATLRTGPFDEALARVSAVRQAISKHSLLMIECDFAFDLATALRVLEMLAPYDCYWVEAPLLQDDAKELARLRARSHQRIASGETAHGREAYRQLFELQSLDVVQPDVKWTGGLMEAKKIAAWAEAYGLLLAPHNNSGPIATAASAQLSLNAPNALILETASVAAEWQDEITSGSSAVSNGSVHAQQLAQRPGLGVSLDEAIAARIAAQPGGATLVCT
jgi:galactonate dehydratase